MKSTASIKTATTSRELSKLGTLLKSLRIAAGLTQDQLAARIGVRCKSVSRAEMQFDLTIAFLERYLSAVGARIKLDSIVSSELAAVLSHSKLGQMLREEGGQLLLPIFEGGRLPIKDVILSIKPKYSNLILEGEKKVELRRRFPLTNNRMRAHIYSTSPVQAVVGSCEIEEVVSLPVNKLWRQYGEVASVEKSDFFNYFEGVTRGYALILDNVRPLDRPIELDELRVRFGFTPPQSFVYASRSLRQALVDEQSSFLN